MSIHILGVDLGKNICSLAGLDGTGAVVFRKRIQRHRLLVVLSELPRCVVAMEACGGAHHVARFCQEIGHEPRLMSPFYVRPYVKLHKTDDRDAVAIAEAASRPTMSFVTIKSAEQLDLQALHRARNRLVQSRTRLVNQARAFLMERSIRVPQGRHTFQRALANLLKDEHADISPRMTVLLEDMEIELADLNQRIGAFDDKITVLAKSDPTIRRLTAIPGIGPMIASALVAAVGDGATSKLDESSGRFQEIVEVVATAGMRARNSH